MAAEGLFNRVPTFALPKVDPVKVLAKYNAGYYENFRLPRFHIEGRSLGSLFKPSYGSDTNADIFTYRDKAGRESIVVSSNCHRGSGPYRCHYCRRDFTTEPLGYVVSTSSYDLNEQQHLAFQTEGIFDLWSCVLAYILAGGPAFERLHPHALSNTVGLYRLQCPEAPPLKPSNDWRLLKCNGGPLDDENWEPVAETKYIHLPNVKVVPARSLFLKQETRV